MRWLKIGGLLILIALAVAFLLYERWWEAPNAPEWALFVLTIPYVAVSVGLLFATRHQAKLTEDALIADKRAFIFASNLAPSWIRNEDGSYSWRVRPQWRNTGETATKRLTLHVECEIRNAPLPLGYVFNYEAAQVGVGFLGPKAEMLGGAVPHVGGITPMDIVESQNNRRFIYLWGWVRYTDMFPNTPEHTTHFCWAIAATGNPNTFDPQVQGQPPTPGVLRWDYVQHIEGNYAD